MMMGKCDTTLITQVNVISGWFRIGFEAEIGFLRLNVLIGFLRNVLGPVCGGSHMG
jgi:hypothetical protein